MAQRSSQDEQSRLDQFDLLYGQTYGEVLSYCRRRCPSFEDADDATTEVFIVAWRRLDEALEAKHAVAWLIGVARKTIMNQRRAEHRRGRLGDRLRQTSQYLTIDPSEISLSDEGVAAAYEAMYTLPPMDQEILMLATFERLSYKEIGQVLGQSSAAVRSRLHRARKQFRAVIADGRAAATESGQKGDDSYDS